jgi:hypothetical protein
VRGGVYTPMVRGPCMRDRRLLPAADAAWRDRQHCPLCRLGVTFDVRFILAFLFRTPASVSLCGPPWSSGARVAAFQWPPASILPYVADHHNSLVRLISSTHHSP